MKKHYNIGLLVIPIAAFGFATTCTAGPVSAFYPVSYTHLDVYKRQTHDHTHVGWLKRKGELNEREARTHPRRNALNQSLGAGHQFVEPHIGAVSHSPGDRFLICSDGLVDGLWDRRIEEIIRSIPSLPGGQSAAQRLVDEAVQASGRDNTTAVVVEIPVSAGSCADPSP